MTLTDNLDLNESNYYQHDFIVLLDSYLTKLREGKIDFLAVTQQQNFKYEGDFYGLLETLGIRKKYHLAIAMVNNVRNSSDYKGNFDVIVIPDLSFIDQLNSLYISKK